LFLPHNKKIKQVIATLSNNCDFFPLPIAILYLTILRKVRIAIYIVRIVRYKLTTVRKKSELQDVKVLL